MTDRVSSGSKLSIETCMIEFEQNRKKPSTIGKWGDGNVCDFLKVRHA